MENNKTTYVSGSAGIPIVVIGTLIALKEVGMTTMSYSDIIWFGVKVWFVCAFIAIAIWLIILFITMLWEGATH